MRVKTIELAKQHQEEEGKGNMLIMKNNRAALTG